MGMRIAIDNNFLDSYYLEGEKFKNKLQRAIKNNKISIYPTIELISEMLSLYEAPKRIEKLYSFSAFLIEYKYRILRPWNEIIQQDIGVSNGSVFLDSKLTKLTDKMLRMLANRNLPSDINNFIDIIKYDKNDRYKFFVESKIKSLKYLESRKKEEINKIAQLSIEDIYNLGLIKDWASNLLKDIFKKSGIVLTENKLKDILFKKDKYPYFHAYVKLIIFENQRHIFKNQKIDMGDSYDKYQLIYSVGLDYFVSGDKNNKKRADSIDQLKGKVINFLEFSNIINSKFS